VCGEGGEENVKTEEPHSTSRLFNGRAPFFNKTEKIGFFVFCPTNILLSQSTLLFVSFHSFIHSLYKDQLAFYLPTITSYINQS
jgi:hypothetical protein